MSRKRSLLFTAAVTAILTIATALPAIAQPPAGGFQLTRTEAAYAEWQSVPLNGGCAGDLFVGFVDGTLQQPLGSRPGPHSDVQAILTHSCGGGATLEGTVPASSCATAQIVSLDSAEVDCTFEISGGGDTATVAIDLEWTATGGIFTERVNNPGMHAAHRTRIATVVGDVEITGTGGDLTGLGGCADSTTLFGDASRITRFNEIQIGGP
jgi:hypothetical protein